jgi:hypothetical protein
MLQQKAHSACSQQLLLWLQLLDKVYAVDRGMGMLGVARISVAPALLRLSHS